MYRLTARFQENFHATLDLKWQQMEFDIFSTG